MKKSEPSAREVERLLALFQQKRFADGEALSRKLSRTYPQSAFVWKSLGVCLNLLGRKSDAVGAIMKSAQLKPDDAEIHFNLGATLTDLQREEEAEQSFRRAIGLKPDYIEAYNNLGSILKNLGRSGEAERCYRQTLEIQPEQIEARYNLGYLLLSLGRYAEGWPYCETRYRPDWKDRLTSGPDVPYPQWQGEPLTGKSLLIWPEQGFGDEIQFARYTTLLKAKGVARLTLVCRPPLKELLAGIDGADTVITNGEPLDRHDYWDFPLSLPLHFGTTLATIPATLPYLKADPQRIERWRPRLPKAGFKVGLVWRGSAGHKNDANRSLPDLASLAPLWKVAGVSFVSLQKGAGEEEAESPPEGQPVLALGKDINDFADTAAIVAQLDLVICVDTSIAHLAGALGKPCWVLLPAVGTDWRWLQERSDSPWYPGALRLFRQTSADSWDETIAEVAQALNELPGMRRMRDSQIVEPPANEVDRLLALFNQDRFADGEALSRKLSRTWPQSAFVWKSLGVCLNLLGRKRDAAEAMAKSAELAPGDAEIHFNLGTTLNDLGRWEEAEPCFRRAIGLKPGYIEALNNLGDALTNLGRAEDAEEVLRQAIETKPDGLEAHFNLGNALRRQRRFGEAESSFRRALELRPGNVETRHNLGFLLLSLGRYAEGWPHYETRYHPQKKGRSVTPPEVPFPQWQGEPLAGKSLLIWPEQGFGDEIQFGRYVPLLKAGGISRLTLVCKPPLKALLETVSGADAVIVRGEPIAAHDYWAFPLSLPLRLGTTLETIPATLPYLKADPQRIERWRPCLPKAGFKVGLVWRGSAGHKNDANRSLPGLASLAPLWKVAGVSFVSLQKGAGEEEAESPPEGQPVLALGKDINDFADTAAIVAQLDLVICVDTSIAHLAGALNKPCWVLLPAVGTDWRWMQKRSDSPWYPGALRLFRQTSAESWDETIAEVAQALRIATTQPHTDTSAKVPDKEIARLIALFNRKQFAEGEALAGEIVHNHPHSALAWYVLGVCRMSMGKPGDAIVPMQKAAELDADNPEVHCNLGIALKQQGRLADAERSYRRAIALKPAYVEAHYNLGIALNDLERFSDAEDCYRQAIAWNPQHADAMLNLGNALKAQRKLLEAEYYYRRAVELRPGYAPGHYNLGTVLNDQGRLPEAETSYRRAIELAPDYAQAHGNLGNVLKEQGRFGEAESSYGSAIALKQNYAQARTNLGILLLSLGRYAEGWPYYEARYGPVEGDSPVSPPRLPFPQWQGEPLAGKSLVVWREQGFGDEIQFVRYCGLLKASGVSRLTLVCQPPLASLLRSVAGVDAVIAEGEPLPFHDYWAFPLSLPLHFGTTLETIPTMLPYLTADPRRIQLWRPRLPKDGFKVGLVWRGSAGHRNDANRSLPGLATLAPLWGVPGVTFVSLQKGAGEDEAASPPAGQPIVSLVPEISDFADTAAIVAQLDLVICVDTSVAHLAGALNKPCWVLLPAVGTDWRWLQERTDSPWYPGAVRLFRQKSADGWEKTVAEMAQALKSAIDDRAKLPSLPIVRPAPQGLDLVKYVEAEEVYRQAIALHPDNFDAHIHLGNLLKKQGRLRDAEASCRRAIELRPDQALAHYNLGNVLFLQRELEGAESSYRRAIELQPDYLAAHVNLGSLLKDRARFAEAEAAFRSALELKPDFAEGRWNLSLLLLLQGKYAEGWPYYEARYDPAHRDRPATKPRLPFPQWQGEPLAGKSLVVWSEQGLGDEIQFARYLPLLKARGLMRLTLVGQPALKTLQRSTPGADAVISLGEALPAHDYWTFLLSLPLRFGTTLQTIPAALPYFRADPERMARWRVRLPRDGFKVGLVWRGSAKHGNDANRSLPGLATLAPLWAVPGASFVSLQKGAGEDEAASPPAGQPIVALGQEISDFADTAAIVAQLDLVICVDTSVAHLAGALNKPCWVLLPAVGTDWRWLQERTDSPWYPGVVRLFRQASAANWDDTVAEVARSLIDRAGNSRDSQPMTGCGKPPDKEIESLVVSQAETSGCGSGLARESTSEAPISRASPLPQNIHANQVDCLLVALFAQKRFTEVEIQARALTERYPRDAFVWKALGACLSAQGKKTDAIEPMQKAAALGPDDVENHLNLALALQHQGRLAEAESSFRRVVGLQPEHVDAQVNLGNVLRDLGRTIDAEQSYRRAIALNRDCAPAHFGLGIALNGLGRLSEAESSYRRAIEIKPGWVRAHGNLGNTLKDLGRLAEAESTYRRAIALDPQYVHATFNLGVALNEQNRDAEAENLFRRTIELQPGHVEAAINLGNILKERQNWGEAERCYRHAIALRPESAEARHNLGILLLSLGRYRAGWPYYEARYHPEFKEAAVGTPKLTFPQWQGEALAGKSLAIWPEQGLGDEIQFARYLPLLKAQGLARLTLICQPGLKPLLQSMAGADAVLTAGEHLPPHDYWVFPLSLPWHFGTTLKTVPAMLPYLAADPQRMARWRPRLPKEGFKVGLVWRGNAAHKNDANRSLPGLAALAPLWAVPGASFVSLQKGAGEDEAASPPAGQPIVPLGREMNDFADTAAIVAQLDLVICVDTSIAHLAGALNKPCWVLLPAVGTDWRWLQERTDSPWYPGALRLFRQKSAGQWEETVAEVARSLIDWVGGSQDSQPMTGCGKPPDKEIESLVALFAQKRFAEVEIQARALTERYPRDAFVWKALGACLTSLGRKADAIAPMQKAATLNPSDPEAHLNLALALKQSGRQDEAETPYRQAIGLQPGNVEANVSLGGILNELGRFTEAENSYRRAIELQPAHFRAHGNLGNVLKAQGRLDEAETSYRRAIELKPDYLYAHFNLAVALQDQGRFAEAEARYRKAIDLKPDYVEAYLNLGTVLSRQGRLPEAESNYRRALEIKPDAVEIHVNLGTVLLDRKQLAEAESSYRKAIELQPAYVHAHGNLGNVLLDQGRFAEAENSYRRALELDPGYAQAHGNLGNALKEQGRFAEAEGSYRRAIELDPDYAQARSNLGILLLALARYAEGWPYYEARYDPKQDKKWIALPELSFPQWAGEPLAGKSILLWPEQGLGDEIQFARYASLLKTQGASRVTLVCKQPLKALLETVVDVDAVITQGEAIPPHDYWAFPLSLPLHLKTTLETLPAALPYLSADPQRLAQWIPCLPKQGLKIGLAWQGNAGHKNDANRSLPGLAALAPLWGVSGVSFVSLQKGPGEEEANSPPEGQAIAALGQKIHDFADTAAIVAQLDLLICVDTSVAHLAGALGKPCWVLLPAVGTDWRWLHERMDSPWYPGVMRLFRQTKPGSWDETINRLREALKDWAGTLAANRSRKPRTTAKSRTTRKARNKEA